MTRFQKLAVAAAVVAYLLIVLGGVVRVSGSGMACGGDWPTCGGRLLPALGAPTAIEYAHRAVAGALTLLALGLGIAGWRRRRTDLAGAALAGLALGLVLLQDAAGALAALTALSPAIVTAHLALAEVVLGALVALSLVALRERIVPAGQRAAERWTPLGRLALVAAAALYALMVTGSYVSLRGAGTACRDWPLCGGHYLPTGWSLVDIQLTHRWVALVATAAVVLVWYQARRLRPDSPAIVGLAAAGGTLMLAQLFVGAADIWLGLAPIVSAAHLALATLIWAIFVAIAALDRLAPIGVPVGGPPPAPRPLRQVTADFWVLTKPGIMLLLLITTLGAMLIAAAGLPPMRIFVWTLIGGALASGGASALNHYLDRDIDAVMPRTRRRPIPGGRVPAVQVAIFGVTLSALAVYVLTAFVNPLSAALALFGNLFYVVVYTKWLKRTTPQNIVIGGAAGAVPPLVGWAAVTNQVGLPALLMAAIVFAWTPPHFWSLALFRAKTRDYGAAHVPMLPQVRGEAETRKQIFLYTLGMVAASLLFVPLGVLGPLYLLAATLLGGWFVWRAVQLMLRPSPLVARAMFFDSLWYLAALFAAMVIDRLLGAAL